MKINLFFASAALVILAAVSCNNKEEKVLAVRLDKTKIELVKGESVQLNATVVPAQEAEFTWFSQDENYVTVDQNGLVKAVGLNKVSDDSDEVTPVSVYVKYENGADECLVTVLPLAPSKVEIVSNNSSVKLKPKESVQLEVKFYPEDADIRNVIWSIDYAGVATVDSKTGIVTGVAPGFAVVKAAYNEQIYSEISINVEEVAPESVSIVPSPLEMKLGQHAYLKTELTPSNAVATHVWTSDDTSVVTVDSNTGKVTAKGLGTTNINVQVGTVSAVCPVTVK